MREEEKVQVEVVVFTRENRGGSALHSTQAFAGRWTTPIDDAANDVSAQIQAPLVALRRLLSLCYALSPKS